MWELRRFKINGRTLFYSAVAVFLTLLLAWNASGAKAASTSPYTLVSVNDSGDGQGGNDDSLNFNHNALAGSGISTESANGHFVAFESAADNLVANDTNGKKDIFIRNLKTNTTNRVNISSSGAQDDGDAYGSAISESGRYVAYQSNGATLDGNSMNGAYYIPYIHDTKTGNNTAIDVNGIQQGYNPSPVTPRAVSNDGRYVVASVGGNYTTAWVYDVKNNTWTQAAASSVGPDGTSQTHISASCDGSLIAFSSDSSNLVPSDTNSSTDVFLVDLRNGHQVTDITKALNNSSNNPLISCNGDYIAFTSRATNAVPSPTTTGEENYYRYDRINDQLSLINQNPDGSKQSTDTYVPVRAITDDGRALFDAMNGGTPYYYIRDEDANITNIVTDNNGGWLCAQAPDSSNAYGINIEGMDRGGKVFTFSSYKTNLISSDTNGHADVFTSNVN